MKQNRYAGKRISLEEVVQQSKEARKTDRFVMVAVGDMVKLVFTGNVYERHASGMKDDEPWEADKLDFELEDSVEGVGHKMFSVAKWNRIVPELAKQLKAGNMALSISKDKNNRYSIKIA